MDVILVDEKDRKIGTGEKIKAHKEGKLHRAFSVFIFNDKKELLLQKRATDKYHSPDLWSNTCCSHPEKEDKKDIIKEAEKRLKEEMGFECSLEEKFCFIYKAELGKNMIEHEYDHVLFGQYNRNPNPNPEEVSDWKWVSLSSLKQDVKKNPEKYTPWLMLILDRIN
jgi:isopentenyl-diphosphate Delta-isomerase